MPVARANGKLSWVAPFSAVIGFAARRGLRPLRYQTYR
jgi:hypothetical protein